MSQVKAKRSATASLLILGYCLFSTACNIDAFALFHEDTIEYLKANNVPMVSCDFSCLHVESNDVILADIQQRPGPFDGPLENRYLICDGLYECNYCAQDMPITMHGESCMLRDAGDSAVDIDCGPDADDIYRVYGISIIE